MSDHDRPSPYAGKNIRYGDVHFSEEEDPEAQEEKVFKNPLDQNGQERKPNRNQRKD